jgi:hypothetical protein
MSEALNAALDHAARGRPVFPCNWDYTVKKIHKTPLIRNGFKGATTARARIKEWWTKWPSALIGVPTGRVSGFFVVDVDVKDGQPGKESLASLESEHGALPLTLEATTPSGGRHLFFRMPADGREVRCSTSKIAPGIDIRGDGGYVIAAPSGVNGHRYEWAFMGGPEFMEPAEAPTWLLEVIERAGKRRKSAESVSTVGAVAEGGRNSHLAQLGGAMRDRGMSREAIEAALLIENAARCAPPLSDAEVQKIAASVARYEPSRTTAALDFDPLANPLPEGSEAANVARTPSTPRRTFTFHSVDELMSAPPPTWRVAGVLPERGLGVIWGGPGSGKTFAALDLCFAVARGVPWQGRRTKQGAVAYIAVEGALRNRVAAYVKHSDLTADTLTPFRGLVSSINLLHKGADLPALLDALRAVVAEVGPLAVVVVDTLARAMPGGDENGPEDMGQMVEAAARITEELGCLTVYVHHSGKNESLGARGHTALKAAADVELSVKRDGSIRTLAVEKLRDGEDGATLLTFQLLPVDLGPVSAFDPDADPLERVTSCVVEPCQRPQPQPKPVTGKVQRAILDALAGGPLDRATLKAEANAATKRRNSVDETLARLVKDRAVVEADGVYSIAEGTDDAVPF